MRASDSMAPTYAGGWDSATRLANLSPDRRLERQARLVVPGDLVAHPDRTTDEHLRERAAPPLRVHRGAKSRHRFFHALARLHLAGDAQSRRTDAEDAPAAVPEVDVADEKVGAPRFGPRVGAELAHQIVPHFALEQRHLATAAIGVAGDALPRDQLDAGARVHHAAMGALEPDRIEMAGAGTVRSVHVMFSRLSRCRSTTSLQTSVSLASARSPSRCWRSSEAQRRSAGSDPERSPSRTGCCHPAG